MRRLFDLVRRFARLVRVPYSWIPGMTVCGRWRWTDIFREPSYRMLERRGEEIYEEMYKSGSALGFLSEIKECFEAAIASAKAERRDAEVKRLRARLDHIITVYRRQFS